jgi:pilus assembly protein FimV
MGSAFALALVVADVHALGVGGLRVQSALNQPFVGEIALLDVKSSELDTVKAQIASAEEFSKAGSERYHYLTGLRFSPQVSPRGETVIRVTSRDPIREPYMDFLLEVTWPEGRLVKGYTVLLDPPVTNAGRTGRIEQPVVAPPASRDRGQADTGSAASQSESPQRQSAPPSPKSQPAPTATAPVGVIGGFPKEIGPVPRGGGLWRLATRNTPAGATAAQTAMALYRNNQDAFANGDINRLRVGKILTIPNAAELFVLGPEAADREFAAALRGEKVRRTPIADPTTLGPESEPRLKIAGAAPEGSSPGELGAQSAESPQTVQEELLLVRETSESTRQETAELRGRIRELEAQLAEIQQLLRLRTAELARIQGAPDVAGGAQLTPDDASGDLLVPIGMEPVEVGTPASSAPVEQPVGQADEAALEPALATSGAAVFSRTGPSATDLVGAGEPLDLPVPASVRGDSDEGLGSSVAGLELVVGDGSASNAAPGLEHSLEPVDTAAPLPSEPQQAGADVSAAGRAEPTSVPASLEPTEQFGSDVLPPWGDLLVPLAGAAAVTALGIGALAWVRVRRRSRLERELESGSPELSLKTAGVNVHQLEELADPSGAPPASGDYGDPGAAAVSPPSIFSALGRSHADSDEPDALSEADIYIAYGRYREAEELLREEIQRTPERIDLKYKLAESYHGARNYPALERLMEEMQSAGEDRLSPERWRRLVDSVKTVQVGEGDGGVIAPGLLRVASAVPGRLDPRPDESLALDIEDSPGLDGGEGPRGGATDGPASATEPTQPDRPALGSSGPASDVLDDLQRLSLELDVGPPSLDLDVQPESVGLDMPSEPGEDEIAGAVSDLELTIDDLRAASELDLQSFGDSRPSVAKRADEPPSRREGARASGFGSNPPKLSIVTSGGARVDEGPALGGLDEVGSSDLLSSQWQMDSGLWDENATKLDLARAYVEMGDSDSAKGILEEVVDEGNEEQRGEAAQMLRALG